MSALVQRGSAQSRPMALMVAIGVHVALVAGLLAMQVVKDVTDDATRIQLRDITEKPNPIPDVTPARPVLDTVRAQVPRTVPEPVDYPADDSITARPMDVTPDPAPVGALIDVDTGQKAVPETPLRFQAVRPADDYYPPQAIRMGAEGVATVRACVDANGGLAGAPTVVRSSHASLLDAAAVKWASEALRFQPATRSGVAVASCKEFRVHFTLH